MNQRDERFANLETIVSFHEDTIQKLNDVIYKQQIKIDKLEEQVGNLMKHFQTPDEMNLEDKEVHF